MRSLTPRKLATRLGQSLAVILLYPLVSMGSLLVAPQLANVATIWLPMGVALSAFLFLGFRFWPAVLLGAFFGHLIAFTHMEYPVSVTLGAALATAVGSTLAAGTGAGLVFRYAGGDNPFGRFVDVVRFVAFGGFVSTLISATIGACTLILLNGSAAEFALTWVTWWMGDATGILVTSFIILSFNHRQKSGWTLLKIAEAITILGSVGLVGWVLFGLELNVQFLLTGLVFWAVVRFAAFETAIVLLLLTLITVAGVRSGNYLYPGPTPEISFLIHQAFLIVLTVATMLLTAILLERRRAEGIMKARMRLLELSYSQSMDEFMRATLDELEAVTGSSIGFYDILEPDQSTLSLQIWSTNTLRNTCKIAGESAHTSAEHGGVWADCIRQKRPIIHNDYAELREKNGMPNGHATLKREVIVPIFRGDLITGIIGVGNKATSYDQTDLRTIAELGDLSWDMVERKRAQQALSEKQRQFRALLRLSRDLERARTYGDAIVAAQKEVESVVGYTDFAVLLITEDQEFFTSILSSRHFQEPPGTPVEPSLLKIKGNRLLEEIANTEGIVVIPDAITDERTAEGQQTGTGNRTMIFVPIFLFGKRLGSIRTGTKADEPIRIPNRMEKEFLIALASHIAVTIDRIRLTAERGQAQQALSASEDRFRLFYENSPLPYVSMDAEGRCLDVNQAFLDTLGYARKEILGLQFSDIVFEADRPRFVQQFQRLKARGRIRDVQFQLICEDGSLIDMQIDGNVGRSPEGAFQQTHCVLADITQRKAFEQQLETMAHYDRLTGLPNRELFFDRLGQSMSISRREGFCFAILYIDLDGFKNVNDTFGHLVGDSLLFSVARRLSARVRESDTVARMGGDEFTVILNHLKTREEAGIVARDLVNSLSQPYHLGDSTCHVTAAIGISIFPDDGISPTHLIACADSAMYRVKQSGKNNYRFCESSSDQTTG